MVDDELEKYNLHIDVGDELDVAVNDIADEIDVIFNDEVDDDIYEIELTDNQIELLEYDELDIVAILLELIVYILMDEVDDEQTIDEMVLDTEMVIIDEELMLNITDDEDEVLDEIIIILIDIADANEYLLLVILHLADII